MKRKILPAALLLILVLALAFALWIYFTKTKNTENVTSPILENNRPNTSSHDENPVPTPDPQTAAPASEEDTEEWNYSRCGRMESCMAFSTTIGEAVTCGNM